MSKSGSGSMLLDELPVMGRPDSEEYVCAFCEYVTTMKELAPNHPSHPTDDWLNRGFAMILLDGSREAASTPEQGTPSAGWKNAGGSPPSRKSNGTWLLQQLKWLTFGLGRRWHFKLSG